MAHPKRNVLIAIAAGVALVVALLVTYPFDSLNPAKLVEYNTKSGAK